MCISNTVKIRRVGNFGFPIVVAYFFPKTWHSFCLFIQKFHIGVAYSKSYKKHDLILLYLLHMVTIVFCCYNFLDLPWENVIQVWMAVFPDWRGNLQGVENHENLEAKLRGFSCIFQWENWSQQLRKKHEN